MGILRGKVVKKDDEKIIKNLEIQSYPWLKFKESDIVFPDNPRKSVITTKYHDPKEMREKIKDALQFKKALQKKSKPILPIDLTLDYENGIRELIKKKRRRMMGEEEAMAMELAEVETIYDAQFKVKDDTRYVHSEESKKEETFSFGKKEKSTENKESKAPSIEAQVNDNSKPIEEVKVTIENQASEQPATEKLAEVLKPEVVEAPVEPVRDEKEWIEKEEERKKQAFEKGYADGFQNGEERAIKAQESKYETVFENISHVVDQIEKLKDSLYSESKEVFLEIIKLSCENILRQQIKYSDESLTSLFDEVLKSISEKSSLKIELNSTDLIRMKKYIEKIGIQDRVTLKENNEKEIGDFIVESEKGIAVVTLKKTVENLVEKLKSDLFAEDEKSESGQAS